MLDETLQSQLRAYLTKIVQPVELIASLDESQGAQEMRALLETISSLTDKVSVRLDGQHTRRPSFQIRRAGATSSLHFAAVPLGHEFTSLVLALLWSGGHPPKVDDASIETIRSLSSQLRFEVFMSLSCHNCPDVVQALTLMSVLNPNVETVVIDGALYQDEVTARQIMAVPMVFLNGELFGSGRMSLEEILAKLDTNSAEKERAKIDSKAPFDVLIVGGGPAGAAAAVYAARKGLRTGIAAERFGGQTNDTLGIENYISVLETNGPKFAADLEAHVRHYDVDIMNLQRVEKLIPAAKPGDLVEVVMSHGGTLRSRSVIVATGARWRNVNVPGESEYRNRGVAYCPHCDGPLFKGKRVAVADAVLVSKLKSLPNVSIVVNAQTTEIHGDGKTVNALSYKDRASGNAHRLELEGVFVQIGLVPNTEFLKGTIELSRFGEIVVDHHGATNAHGVFAAGDVTTVPYKQIVIAAGDGAKAALGAFDYLIRSSAPAVQSAA
ncbi:MAG: alkyl hydroperoxide reductase subunit F [Gammaproteobacteria bacterium]|nr:alkyl hydroperoxide reductase subunit F [Gammaproteobacteria bacterium]